MPLQNINANISSIIKTVAVLSESLISYAVENHMLKKVRFVGYAHKFYVLVTTHHVVKHCSRRNRFDSSLYVGTFGQNP